jgi:hypothetical protein
MVLPYMAARELLFLVELAATGRGTYSPLAINLWHSSQRLGDLLFPYQELPLVDLLHEELLYWKGEYP